MMNAIMEAIQGGVIISCQAYRGEPTFGSHIMAAFALAAQQGGALGIRANSPDDVRAIKEVVNLPVIGLWKRESLDGRGIIITPTFEDAQALAEAGAEIIALDVTNRPRPGGVTAGQLIQRIKSELGVLTMADCVTLDDALFAQAAGADFAAPTLSFPDGIGPYDPDFTLIKKMVSQLKIPVIAEGRFWEPEHVQQAFEMGVFSVVIGSAVTRPWLITKRFADMAQRRSTLGNGYDHA